MDPNKELQNDEFDDIKDDAVSGVEEENAQKVSPAGSAPDSQGNDENSADDGIDYTYEDEEPPHVAVARQHAKYREEERRRIAAEEQLKKFQAQQPADQPPVIPPMPDPYEEDYEEKVKIRDQKLRESFEYENRQKFSQNQQQQQVESGRNREIESIGQNYMRRAEEFKVPKEDLQLGSKHIQDAGLSEDLVRAILEDDKGPLITRFMAKNPTAAIRLSEMSPIQAIQHLERVIRPKLNAKKTTKATPPPQKSGGGASQHSREKYPLTAGKAKFS